jgi:hypothetical protein
VAFLSYSNIDVAAQPREQLTKSFDRKLLQASARDSRYFGLIDFEHPGSLDLGQLSLSDQSGDRDREIRFGVELLGVGESEIFENISTTSFPIGVPTHELSMR